MENENESEIKYLWKKLKIIKSKILLIATIKNNLQGFFVRNSVREYSGIIKVIF